MTEQPRGPWPDVEDVEALLVEAFSKSHTTAVDMPVVTAAAQRRGRVLRRRRQVTSVIAACAAVAAVVGVSVEGGRLARAVQQPAQRTVPPGPVATPSEPGRKTAFGSHVDYLSCPAPPGNGAPMPPATSKFVIVGFDGPPLGVNPSLAVNPCLSMEVDWARSRGMTVQFATNAVPVTLKQLQAMEPGGASSGPTRLAQAQSVGRERGRALVTLLSGRGLSSPVVWINVTAQYPPWPTGTQGQALNEALIRGMVAGIQDAGVTAGIATTAQGWAMITGSARIPSAPVWIGLTPSGYPDEASACRSVSPTGGTVHLVAWSVSETDGSIDVSCPANPMVTP